MSAAIGPTVLVVEDHPDTRDSLLVLLSMSGYATASAVNGQDALDYLQGHPAPGLILLDLRMPVMSGIEFLQRKQADPVLATIPVLVCSAEVRLALEAASYGAHAYRRKPLDPEELLRVVARLCLDQKAARPASVGS